MSDGTRPAERLAVRLTKGALVAVLAGGLTATAAAAKITGGDDVAARTGTSAVVAAQQTADPVAVKVAEARTAVVDVASDAVEVARTAQSVGKATDVDDDDLSELAKATDTLEDLVEKATTVETPTPATSSADGVDGTTPQTEPTPTDDGLTTSPSAAPSAPAVDGPLTSAAETPDMPATEPVDADAEAATIDGLDEIVVPEVAGPEDATTSELRKAVATIVTLSTAVEDSAQEAAEAAEKKAAAAEAAAQRAAWKKSLLGYANGQIPASALCNLTFDTAELRCDAAEDIERLNAAYRKAFGTDLAVTDSYRSYAGQVSCRLRKGYLCATPGTSNHGTGIAVDLGGGVQTFGSVQHQWMVDHAAQYGWVHPSWAEPGSSKPEAWHWEYAG